MMFLAILLAAAVNTAPQEAPEYLEDWKEGYFDIHAISTGKGESTFYIFPDGTTMLCDAGDMTGYNWPSTPYPDDSMTPAQWIARYIKHFSKRDTVDYFLLSHFHDDHMGSDFAFRPGQHGYELCGITEVGEYIHFDKIVDRGYPDYDFPSKEVARELPTSRYVENYIKFVGYQHDCMGSDVEQFRVATHSQFTLKNSPKAYDFDIWNVAGNARIARKVLPGSRPMYGKKDDLRQFDENMFSCVQLIRYGDFYYYHGGDVPGTYWNQDDPKPFSRAFEAQIADRIGHGVDVMKANHHGTQDASTYGFLEKMRPNAVIFLCAVAGHPSYPTIRRMLDPQLPGSKLLFATTDVSEQHLAETWKDMQPWGHIVVRVYDGGKRYRIFVLDATSKDYRIKYSSPEFKVVVK